MRRIAAMVLALLLVLGLCACGKEVEPVKERDCGVYVTIEANDVYTVSYGTDAGSESTKHADDTPLDAGEVVHFDFAGDAAEGTAKAIIDYSICIYDKALNVLAVESFSSDFSNMARVDITVTADHHIINASDKLVCGGDTIVEMAVTKPEKGVSLTVPTVTMPNRPEAAKAINDSITAVNETFTGEQLKSSRKAYNDLAKEASDDEKLDAFSQNRYVRVTRGDSAVVSFRMFDKANLGSGSASAITGHNYDAYTGAELKLADITDNTEEFVNTCSEEIFSILTDESKYADLLFVEGYTDKVKDLVSDGHWYMNNDGVVIAINPGEIADSAEGAFEFTVKYDVLAGKIKDEFIPAELDGSTGDIDASLAKDADTASLTMVGSEASKDIDSVLVTVTGKIYNISVYSANYYKSSGKYSLETQLWYCSDLTEGAAFAINKELKTTPSIFIGFTRPDGTYERRLLSADSSGKVTILDPDGGETGTLISGKLPYSADINSDETQEKISTTTDAEGLLTLVIESGGSTFEEATTIKTVSGIRLYDIDADGKSEIFIDGKTADGSTVTHAFKFDGELTACSFGESDYASGAVKEFTHSKLYLKRMVNILGTYTAEVGYTYSDGTFKNDSSVLKLSGTNYVTTSKDLTLADGKIIPSGYKLKFTETDGSSYIDFTTDQGLTGKIAIEKAESGWTINGNADTSYFESLPYKK